MLSHAFFLSTLLYLSTATPLALTKRNFAPSPWPPTQLSDPLPGAAVPYDCTPSTPCGIAQDPTAAATYYTIKDPASGVGGPTSCGYDDPNKLYTDVVLDDVNDNYIAVDVFMMGSLSSGDVMNPMCGQNITVTNTETGLSATGMVVDKCMGCHSNWGLDLSPHLYDAVGGTLHEGFFPLTWYWETGSESAAKKL